MFKTAYVKVEVSSGYIGIPPRFYAFYEGYHVADMLGGLTYNAGPKDIHPLNVGKKSLGIQFGHFQHGFAPLRGASKHFIFPRIAVPGKMAYIGDIHHMLYRIPPVPKGADKNIMGYIGPKVPDMGVGIHRGTTPVKPHDTWYKGFKLFYRAAKCIV
jgi:hypothetical protein